MLRRTTTPLTIFTLLLLTYGCARHVQELPREEIPVIPPFHGKKIKANVVQFGISKEALEKYPELKEKRIGFGLCNRLVDTFYDSGYFDLVEEKEAIKKRIMDQWLHNAVFSETMDEPGGFAQPEFLIYAEVYDFGIRDASSVKGIKAKDASETWLKIQVRAVLYSNGEYIPASATGRCYLEKKGAGWGKKGESFDSSSIGKASEIALQKAVIELIRRLKTKGFFPDG